MTLNVEHLNRTVATLEQALLAIEKHPESSIDIEMMLSFLEHSSPQRGIVR